VSRASAVVLAAGEASRFGSPKQLLLLPPVLTALAASPVDEIVVVEGAYAVGDVGTRVVFCPDWEKGPGASLRCGLRALGDDVAAAVVVLADGPMLAPAAVERVLGAWRDSGAQVVAASYGGSRGHPLVLGRKAWAEVPDDGLRRRDVLLVPCDDLGSPGDIDTPEDLPA
jgi:CTP:molybdopterin cytidylyltransferase MocA